MSRRCSTNWAFGSTSHVAVDLVPKRRAGTIVSAVAQPITITSLHDPRIDVYRDVRDADLRGRDKLFMAESELVIRRLLRTPQRLHSLFLSPNKYERLRDVIEQPGAQDIPVYLAEVGLISEIAGFLIHRGALAAGHRPTREQRTIDAALGHLREQSNFTMLLAEGVTNVDNMGGLFRNAAAFGADGIALDPNCCDPLYRKAIRVSAGHALSIPYADCDRWLDDLSRLKGEWGLTLVAAESVEHAKALWQMPQADRLGILLGSEAHGVSANALALCDHVCEIPMQPGVPSLNVATAAAVFLYERRRALQGGTEGGCHH